MVNGERNLGAFACVSPGDERRFTALERDRHLSSTPRSRCLSPSRIGDRTDNGAVHSSPRPPPSPCGAPYGVQPRRTPDSPYRVVPEPTSRSEGSHRPDRHLALEPSPEPSGSRPPIGRRILREVLVLQGRARRIGGARGNPSRRTCSRIWSMTSGSVTSAITRSRPPQ